MIETEKLATIERIQEIIEDQMKLENHYTTEQRGNDAIDFTRLNAYVEIVNAIIGQGTMK